MIYRPLRESDIEAVKAIIASGSPYLSLNGNYNYWMMAHVFSEYCYVAEEDGEICGIVTAIPNPRESTLFVWQLGVAEMHRRRGVAYGLIDSLVKDMKKDNFTHFVTSISADNAGSLATFNKIARTYGMTRETIGIYEAADVTEDLYRFSFKGEIV